MADAERHAKKFGHYSTGSRESPDYLEQTVLAKYFGGWAQRRDWEGGCGERMSKGGSQRDGEDEQEKQQQNCG